MICKHLRCMAALLLASQLGVAAPTTLVAGEPGKASPAGSATTTPIKHLVVIFQENVSFDHYFATYPVAGNPPRRAGVSRAEIHAVGQRAFGIC